MLLLMIDAHSKWLEIHVTNSATATVTTELLRKSFASLGLPEVIISDNAATFTSEEMEEFMKKNGIKHIRSPPYHPASNGLVERAVQTFKEGMKRLKSGTLNTRLSRFLLRYWITPHSSTGLSPSELMWGRTLRSQLDLLWPDPSRKAQQAQDRQKQSHDARWTERQFNLNDTMYARNYSTGPRWLPGYVVSMQGSAMYDICLSDNRVICRHLDQLRPRVNSGTCTTESTVEDLTVDGRAGLKADELVTAEPDLNCPEVPPAPEAGVTDPHVETLPVATSQVEEPLEPESAESQVRRSSRVRHRPVRFEE